MKWGREAFIGFCVGLALTGLPMSGEEGKSPVPIDIHVTAADLLGQPVGANWTSYNGDYSGRRFSSLREINVANVAQLRAQWVFHPGNTQTLEATPVVIRGMMYVTSAN